MATVAVLGTGRMGSAMAGALAAAAHDLLLWNRTGDRAATLAGELGGRAVATPSDAAAQADVCLTMLADGAAVDAVFAGPDGLLTGARPGVVLVDSSTVPPAIIQGHEAAARAAGARILDAPVSGSVALAAAGKLTLMVGGTPEDLAAARPVLDALAGTLFHLGPLGSGAAMKLAVNTVIYGLNEAVAEALVLAESAGVDRVLAYDVLASSAVAAPFVGYKRAAFIDPEGTPVAFAADLAAKDLRLIRELAMAVDVPLPQATTDLAVMDAFITAGGGARDFAAVADHLRGGRSTRATAIDADGTAQAAGTTGEAATG